jgi:dipeptidyl aminopeptidase/acylaminoacyl peptidase
VKSRVIWKVIILVAACWPLTFTACTVEREVDFMAGAPVTEPVDLFGVERYSPDVDAFAEIGWYGTPGLTPDGHRVFFTSGNSGTAQLYDLTGPGWPYQLTFFPNGIDWYELSREGDLAVVSASAGGSENSQLYLIDTRMGRTRRLTDKPDAAYGSVIWSRDDQMIFLRSNEENLRDFKLYRMDLATCATTKLVDIPGDNAWEDLSPDGRSLLFSHRISKADNDLYLYSLETKDTTCLTHHQNPSLYQNACFDAEGARLYLTSNAGDRELMLRASLDIEKKKLSFLEPDSPWNVDILALSPSRQVMVWVINQDGYGRMKLVELKSGRELPTPKVNGLINDPALSESSRMLFTFDSPTQAPDIWSWDWQSEVLKRITLAAYAGVDSTQFAEPKLVTYGSFDGLQVQGFLYLPADYRGGAIPFLVDLHDGPDQQYRPSFNPLIQYLIRHGYGVLAPNIRGSGGYGKKYEALDDYKLRLDAVKDVKAAVEWLFQNRYTHPGLVGIAGKGYGGYLVLAAITEYPNFFSAAWDESGIVDFATFLENAPLPRRDFMAAEYGPLYDREFLQSISPIRKADRIRIPLMVVHGEDDHLVPVGQARQIIEAIQNRGGVVDSLIFRDEGHEVKKPADRLALYRAMVIFFDTNFKGARSEDVQKKDL